MKNKKVEVNYPCVDYGFDLITLTENEKTRYKKNIYYYNNSLASKEKNDTLTINQEAAEKFFLKSTIEFIEMITYDDIGAHKDMFGEMNSLNNDYHHKRFYLLPEIRKDLKKINLRLSRINTEKDNFNYTKVNRYNIFTKIKAKKKWGEEEINKIVDSTFEKANLKVKLDKANLKPNVISSIGFDMTSITDIAISDIKFRFELTKLSEINSVYKYLSNQEEKYSLRQALRKSVVKANTTERNLFLALSETVEMEIFADVLRNIIKNKLPEALSIYRSKTNLINALLEKAEVLYGDYVLFILLRDNESENFLDTEMLTACVYRIYELKNYEYKCDPINSEIKLRDKIFIRNVNILTEKIVNDMTAGVNTNHIIDSYSRIISVMQEKCKSLSIDAKEVFLFDYDFDNINKSKILENNDYRSVSALKTKNFIENIKSLRNIRKNLNIIDSNLQDNIIKHSFKETISFFNEMFPKIGNSSQEEKNHNDVDTNRNLNTSIEMDDGIFYCIPKQKFIFNNDTEIKNFIITLNLLSKNIFGEKFKFENKTKNGGLSVFKINCKEGLSAENNLSDEDLNKIKEFIDNTIIEIRNLNNKGYEYELKEFLKKEEGAIKEILRHIDVVEKYNQFTEGSCDKLISLISGLSHTFEGIKNNTNLLSDIVSNENYQDVVVDIQNVLREKELNKILSNTDKESKETRKRRKI